MEAALRVLLPYLVLSLPAAAFPKAGSEGERIAPGARLELNPPGEPGLEAERANASSQEGVRPSLAVRARAPAAPGLFSRPSAAARCLWGVAEDGAVGWMDTGHPWPLGGLEGPVCRVKMDQEGPSPRLLDVVGVLTRYESGFIKLLSQRSAWDGTRPEPLGLCPGRELGAALQPLQRIHQHLREPGPERLLVLHLEEVQWGARVTLRFGLDFQAPLGRWLGELRGAVLLFYPGTLGHRGELLVTGAGLAREQVGDTAGVRSWGWDWGVSPGLFPPPLHPFPTPQHLCRAPLTPTETQQLLFGSDDKCFTRMTPVLLLLARSWQDEVALGPSSYLSADGVLDVAPYPQLSPAQPEPEELLFPTAPSQGNVSAPAPGASSQFLGILTRFIRQVLSPPSASSEPPTQPSSHHWLDFQVMETLPHQLLNLSEEAALERLVQSEEPSVLLFPQDSGAVLEQHLGGWQPEGTVLQLLMGKLQAVIQELRDIPAFQENTGLFQHLLSFCYYPGPGAGGGEKRPPGSGKLHTLLLLKALQTVRARWQERRKVLRQNRSARHQAHCRLQELTIDLRDRKFIVMPTVYAANNCEGPCKLPLSTRVPSYHSHTVLLLGMQERGSLLQRAPCCVPVRYSDQLIISLSAEGLEVRKFPNMVAEECGCR
ncbi:MIS factor, partial [Columbina picui]|nr:MIS factor [Columbina picui]